MTSDIDFSHDGRFYRETVVDIDAAVIGISRSQWKALEASQATQERAEVEMRKGRFDILPIISDRTVRKYYGTTTWGDYSTIQEHLVQRQDIISHQAHIRDVIKGLSTDNRSFYFLSYEHYIVGLLSIADLNCRQVKIYLFSLLSELEIHLGVFITTQVTEERLLELTLDDGKPQHVVPKARFEADRVHGLDAPLIQYLYLADLLSVIAKLGLFKKLGFDSRSQFERACNPLNELRNEVAHPTRSLIGDSESVKKLWRDIDRIEELIFRLR